MSRFIQRYTSGWGYHQTAPYKLRPFLLSTRVIIWLWNSWHKIVAFVYLFYKWACTGKRVCPQTAISGVRPLSKEHMAQFPVEILAREPANCHSRAERHRSAGMQVGCRDPRLRENIPLSKGFVYSINIPWEPVTRYCQVLVLQRWVRCSSCPTETRNLIRWISVNKPLYHTVAGGYLQGWGWHQESSAQLLPEVRVSD